MNSLRAIDSQDTGPPSIWTDWSDNSVDCRKLGTNVPFDPQGRIFMLNWEERLCYKRNPPLSLASMVLGSPSIVKSLAIRGGTGVDEHTGVLLG